MSGTLPYRSQMNRGVPIHLDTIETLAIAVAVLLAGRFLTAVLPPRATTPRSRSRTVLPFSLPSGFQPISIGSVPAGRSYCSFWPDCRAWLQRA
jgi:hypothetical protein